MQYRPANTQDSAAIAQLHAQSWRRTYRGLFSDSFLDNDADDDRRYVWQQRLAANRDDQCVIVADDNTSIIGFVCVYGREDSNWGALIDNLHVAEGFHRQGIGTTLMQHAFQWLNTCFPNDPVYLWVMENNYPARKFYEQLGAMQAELVDKPNPAGDGSAMNCRYTWEKAVICPVSR